MKKNIFFTAAILLLGLLLVSFNANAQRIELGRTNSAQRCANVTDEGFSASFSFSSIETAEISTEKGVFSILMMDGTYPSGAYGAPELPAANQLIAIPFGAQNATVKVKSYTTSTYRLADYGIKTVMPHQPSVSKSAKPEDIKFIYDEKAYAAKSFSQRPIASLEVRGTMRGIQVGALTINPVAYNPAENTIMVYNDIEVEVSYNDYDKIAAENEFVRTFSPYFANVYKTMFNWRDNVYDQHPDLWQAPVKMLVIANRMFKECMQEWVAWKTMKGFYMDVNYTDQIGNSASAIRHFIQDKYATDAPTFVIIFGDKDQVPASTTGTESHCVTDLKYMSVDNDNFPDIYHSRMCAATVEQMQNIITKTLMYEQYVNLNTPKYLSNVLLVAGWDEDWNPKAGKPTIQYAMEYYYNAEHGFNNVYSFLERPYNQTYASLNTGVGFVNYTAHGSNDGWAEPSLSVSDVNNFTNEGMPFLAMGNCCDAANWGINGTSFGEAMIRANTRGAYAYIGSCPNTLWYEDYYFAVGATNVFNRMPTYEETAYGAYDAIWDDDVFNTVSSIPFIGNIAVCYSHAGSYSSSVSDQYYWEAYHALGDGSIMPFRVQPTANMVSHMEVMPIGVTSFEIHAFPGSYVAVSKDGVLHGAGLVEESGIIALPIEPITSGGDVTICVTSPRYTPYIATIPAASLDGPYIAVNEYTPNIAHIGEETYMRICFKNVGADATGGTTRVNLTCDNENVTILNGTASFGNLVPNAIAEIDGFSYRIADGVADGSKFMINAIAVCDNETWEGKITITAGKAVMEYQGMQWDGSFVPGGTIDLVAMFKNTGHYVATNAVASISSTSEHITFENPTFEVGSLDPMGIAICRFTASISPDCPTAEHLPVIFTFQDDGDAYAEGSAILKNSCNIIFELRDSYGDGWNGNKLNVEFDDDTPTQQFTITGDNSQANYVIEVNVGVHVTLSWVKGQYASECSFSVLYENGDVICAIDDASQISYQWSSPWSFAFECNCGNGIESYLPVENLQAEASYTSVTLTWEAPEGCDGYIVKRNGLEIGQTTETTYVDELVSTEGYYTYCVEAKYSNDVSLPECVIVEYLDDIEEADIDLFSIYPNPVNHTLYINGGNAEFDYVIYNGMGQMVISGQANGKAQVNVSDMTKGVYFIRINTGTQVRVEKVVVK